MRILIEGQSAALSARLDAALAAVERRFADELVSDLDCVNTLAKHLEQYRGKMLRPTLVLLCEAATHPNAATAEPSDAALTLATVVEMVHMATLVHDDVLDDQELRRRGTTINTLHGNEAAVMLGDYLISHAYHLCSSLDSQEAARLVARSTNTVCEGELLQLAHRNRFDITEPTYFDIIHRKTAALCGVACRLGVMSSGADSPTADAAAAYGEALGSAFQIVDDVLDLTGDASIVGKSLGKDLAKGKLTLPLIHRLSVADDAEREWLVPALTAATEADAARLGQHVAASDSLAYAQATAQRLVDDAKSRLAPWPDSDAKSLLLAMADAVIDRRF